MRAIIVSILLVPIFGFSQRVYVDNQDAVYPVGTTEEGDLYDFDINSDGRVDYRLKMYLRSCNKQNISGNANSAVFIGVEQDGLTNRLNSTTSDPDELGIDCTNDTLNIEDVWSTSSTLYVKFIAEQETCVSLNEGSHKQGFQLLVKKPGNTILYGYGYIEYTIANTGDIIVHGWYYENRGNTPIVANSNIDFPYGPNCVVYDTVLVSVTDTLIIDLDVPNGTKTIDINGIKIYPNPTQHLLIIDLNKELPPGEYIIQLINTGGQTVFSSLLTTDLIELDLSVFPVEGIYLLHLLDKTGNLIIQKKILIN